MSAESENIQFNLNSIQNSLLREKNSDLLVNLAEQLSEQIQLNQSLNARIESLNSDFSNKIASLVTELEKKIELISKIEATRDLERTQFTKQIIEGQQENKKFAKIEGSISSLEDRIKEEICLSVSEQSQQFLQVVEHLNIPLIVKAGYLDLKTDLDESKHQLIESLLKVSTELETVNDATESRWKALTETLEKKHQENVFLQNQVTTLQSHLSETRRMLESNQNKKADEKYRNLADWSSRLDERTMLLHDAYEDRKQLMNELKSLRAARTNSPDLQNRYKAICEKYRILESQYDITVQESHQNVADLNHKIDLLKESTISADKSRNLVEKSYQKLDSEFHDMNKTVKLQEETLQELTLKCTRLQTLEAERRLQFESHKKIFETAIEESFQFKEQHIRISKILQKRDLDLEHAQKQVAHFRSIHDSTQIQLQEKDHAVKLLTAELENVRQMIKQRTLTLLKREHG